MIETVASILSSCGTPKTNICPTILYNEGWMTRLLVSISTRHNIFFAVAAPEKKIKEYGIKAQVE